MNRQRDFLFVMMLATAAMTPAAGQDVTPAIGAGNSNTQLAASIPNFSGVALLSRLQPIQRCPVHTEG